MSATEMQDSAGPKQPSDGQSQLTQGRAKSLALYRKVLNTVFLAGVFFVSIPFLLFLVPTLLAAGGNWLPSIFLLVLMAGGIGALFSSLIRVFNYDNTSAEVIDRELHGINHYHLFLYSLVPLVVGSIAAGVFFLIMASGMLQGTMFARFACTVEKGCNTLTGMAQYWSPATAQDYGKAMIWGFVCGFAERLIPDALKDYLSAVRRSKREL
jgi:hypothetical protein